MALTRDERGLLVITTPGMYTYNCRQAHCHFVVASRTQDPVAHSCPYPGGTTTYGPEYTMSLLSECWEHLDSVVARIIEEPNSHDAEYNKAYANGLAYMLAKFMNPHFTTPQEISKEAAKRYKNRKAGVEYETPGIGSQRYIPPRLAEPTKRAPLTRSTQQVRALSEKETQGILNGKDFFPAEQVAQMYSVPVAEVERLWASA